MHSFGPALTDHQVIFAPYVAAQEAHTLDGIVANKEDEIKSKCAVRLGFPRVRYLGAE